MPVFWSVLQGREKFRFLGLSYLVSFSGKCAFGILFALIGWGVDGVLFGVILSLPLAFLAGFPPIRNVLAFSDGDEGVDLKPLYRFSLPVVTALLLLSLYCQLDVALVRHFFGDTRQGLVLSGFYASAAIIGKGFFFLPMGITLVLFPKVARKKALGENPLPVLKRWLFIEVALSLIGILATLILSRYIALILGNDDPELMKLIKMFAIAITPIAATIILVNYNLASERYFFIWFLMPITLLTFAAIIFLFHGTPMSVLLTMTVGGLALFTSISIFTFLPGN